MKAEDLADHDASASLHGINTPATNTDLLAQHVARMALNLLLEPPDPPSMPDMSTTLKPDDAADDTLILTTAETTQMAAILAPVLRNLQGIKRLTPENLPPQSKHIRTLSYLQILKRRLLPVGECIVAALTPLSWQQRGALELKLCRHIATEYWPLPISTYTHLRIMEMYRNALMKKALLGVAGPKVTSGTSSRLDDETGMPTSLETNDNLLNSCETGPAEGRERKREQEGRKHASSSSSQETSPVLGAVSPWARKGRRPLKTSNYYDCLASLTWR